MSVQKRRNGGKEIHRKMRAWKAKNGKVKQ